MKNEMGSGGVFASVVPTDEGGRSGCGVRMQLHHDSHVHSTFPLACSFCNFLSPSSYLMKTTENEVRREDQENINKFGRLNARLYEVRGERDAIKKKLERIDDASTELMMGSGDKVMLMLGDAFFESSEDDATEFCEAEVEKYQAVVDKLEEEESEILEEQEKLKKILYTRFGKSINLEDS